MPDPAFFPVLLPVLIPVLLLLLSPAVGSFLNVVIDRLPRGESLIRPGSTCRSCQTRLGARDLLPVLSYLISRGRCRHCGGAIAPWHLYVELAAVGVAVLALALGGSGVEMALSALILWLLLALALCDLLWFRLPDLLTGMLALAALGWALLTPPPIHPLLPWSPGEALAGGLIGAAAFWVIRILYYLLRRRQGLGLGDVKLMVGLGALCGPWLLPHLVLAAALLALACALGPVLMRRRRLRRTHPLPFGAALSAAAALIWLLARLAN